MLNPLNTHRLRYHLARAATWVRYEQNEVYDALPPMHVVQDLLAHPDPPLPPLDRIVGCPVFATDGTLILEPGYHAAARLFYAPEPGLVIPDVAEAPTPEEIARARGLFLDDLLVDFPFVMGNANDSDENPERAHAVAFGLQPFVRELIEGPTPLYLVEKPSPGTGAGLLIRVLGRIALGRPPAVMAAARDEEEWRKRLTSLLSHGAEIVLIDNLPMRGRLESAALSAAITAPTWTDRVLGYTRVIEVPVRCTWVANGNNPTLSSELARRAARIRLDAKMDQPWRRKHFKHKHLDHWTREHRGELIWAALTLVRAWLAAGRPPGRHVLGEFESWSSVLGGILDVAGIRGFLGNLDEFYATADTEGVEIRAFLHAWWEKHRGFEVGVEELFPLAVRDDVGLDLGEKGERSQRTKLGTFLRDKLRDRRVTLALNNTEYAVQVVPAGKRGAAGLWKLIILDDQGQPSHPGPTTPSEQERVQGLGRFIGLPPITPDPANLGKPSPGQVNQGLLANSSENPEFPAPINLVNLPPPPAEPSPTGPIRTPLLPKRRRTPLPPKRPSAP